jgi:hypothetical protein
VDGRQKSERPASRVVLRLAKVSRRRSRTLGALVLLLVLAVAVGYVAGNFQRWFFPIRSAGLLNTAWHVESVDGEQVADIAATLILREDEAVLESVCGRTTFGWDFDTDGTQIGFALVRTDQHACSDAEQAAEQRIVVALPSTTDWSVFTVDSIEFKGASTIRLMRLTGASSRSPSPRYSTNRLGSNEPRSGHPLARRDDGLRPTSLRPI